MVAMGGSAASIFNNFQMAVGSWINLGLGGAIILRLLSFNAN